MQAFNLSPNKKIWTRPGSKQLQVTPVSQMIISVFNPLSHMPILGSAILAVNKDMMSKI